MGSAVKSLPKSNNRHKSVVGSRNVCLFDHVEDLGFPFRRVRLLVWVGFVQF